jgi:hypothetical protein
MSVPGYVFQCMQLGVGKSTAGFAGHKACLSVSVEREAQGQ